MFRSCPFFVNMKPPGVVEHTAEDHLQRKMKTRLHTLNNAAKNVTRGDEYHPVEILCDNICPSGWPSRSPGSVENITGETVQNLIVPVSWGREVLYM